MNTYINNKLMTKRPNLILSTTTDTEWIFHDSSQISQYVINWEKSFIQEPIDPKFAVDQLKNLLIESEFEIYEYMELDFNDGKPDKPIYNSKSMLKATKTITILNVEYKYTFLFDYYVKPIDKYNILINKINELQTTIDIMKKAIAIHEKVINMLNDRLDTYTQFINENIINDYNNDKIF